MSQAFDPGPVSEPFATLARNYPGPDATTPTASASSGGRSSTAADPTAARGSCCSARTPASTSRSPTAAWSASASRASSWKLGIERSYVMVNAFPSSVYGQPRREDVEQLLKQTARYRKRWLDALLDGTDVRAVVAFGAIAEQVFLRWQRTASGRRFQGHFEPLTHPTMPDATARPGSAT
jgi:hypothetical protein